MLAHLPLALILQALGWAVGRACGVSARASLWAGAYAAIAACVSREVAQAEYRWIEAHGHLRRLMPDLQGLKIWEWNAHSLAETAVAAAVVLLVAALGGYVDSGSHRS